MVKIIIRIAWGLLYLCAASGLSGQVFACDADFDGDVDQSDIRLIFNSRGTRVASGDPRDADGSGVIDILDARQCVLQCTQESCPGNDPPQASAGLDQRASLGQTVILDGSGSTDPDGDPLTYRWLLITVPAGSQAALSDPTAVRPTFVVDVAGEYMAQLIVNDGAHDSAPDTVTISTEGTLLPVAEAGPNQTARPGQMVTLDGSGSTDPDGGPLATYRWSLIMVPAGSNATLSDPSAVRPTFVVDVPGIYKAQLIVTDDKGASSSDEVTISTTGSLPVAKAGFDQIARPGQTITLDGSGSTDVDGDRLTYRWSLLSVPAGSGTALSDPTAVRPFFTVDVAGEYVAQLIVNDGIFDSAPDTIIISVNIPPIAQIRPVVQGPLPRCERPGFVGRAVTLDGSVSTDPDGNPLNLIYRWSLLSKPAGSQAALSDPSAVSPTFVIDLKGTYVVQLIVNDGVFDSAPVTTTVDVVNNPPVANAGLDQLLTIFDEEGEDTVTLDGSASFDIDCDPLTYRWSLTTVPVGSDATLSDPSAVRPTFVADMAGTYVAQLIVNDGTVDSTPDTVVIDAIPPLPTLEVNMATASLTVNEGVSTPLRVFFSDVNSLLEELEPEFSVDGLTFNIALTAGGTATPDVDYALATNYFINITDPATFTGMVDPPLQVSAIQDNLVEQVDETITISVGQASGSARLTNSLGTTFTLAIPVAAGAGVTTVTIPGSSVD